MSYAFIIGKHTKLSLAEIATTCTGLDYIPGRPFVTVEQIPVPPVDLLNRLGGTLEIIEIKETHVPQAAIEKEVTRIVLEAAQFINKKFMFGINVMPDNFLPNIHKKLLNSVKKALKENNLRGAFANRGNENVSRVFVGKQGLDAIGTNVWIIKEDAEHCTIGVTRGVQDIDAYAQRDYEKPYRDAFSGMLPPKLAQVMLNLAVGDRAPIVYDPFCGSGTVLGEALLMGFDVVGSDKDKEIIAGAEQNMQWLRDQFKIEATRSIRLFTKSATMVSQQDVLGRDGSKVPLAMQDKRPLAIVTEPYLGPPLRQRADEREVQKIMGELTILYLDFFKNLASWVPRETVVVFAFPLWRLGPARGESTGFESIGQRLVARIEALGYTLAAFDPSQDTSLIYTRPDQLVAREIMRFVKR